MSMRRAAFAIPGDITTPTGGYIYERRLLQGLRAQGRDVQHLALGASFPDPSRAHMRDAIAQLQALDAGRIVILDGFVSATLDTDALRDLHVPSLAMVHHPLAMETGLAPDRRDYLYHTERANLAHVDHVLVPSPATAAILTGSYDVPSKRITIARPGTDRPARPSAPGAPPLILSVGIQHPRKGHDILLQALACLTHMEWTAVIAGKVYDATYARELVSLQRDLDLGARVRLAGFVPDAELSALYARASVFALATRYEGYGLVFDEALAHGLPIVSCRVGAVPDTVPAAAGRLVAPDCVQDLAEALGALLSNADVCRACADAARAAGQRLPGWDDTAQTVGRVLDRL